MVQGKRRFAQQLLLGQRFDLPEAESVEQEVANRRALTKKLVAILTESDEFKGEERAQFVREKFESLEASMKA